MDSSYPQCRATSPSERYSEPLSRRHAAWTPIERLDRRIDLAIDKGNPDIMLATTWDKIRDEKSRIYGPNSYLYRSTDAGHTWTKIQNPPLPQSETNPALQTVPE